MLLAALFLCMSAASCSDTPTVPSQNVSNPTETITGSGTESKPT